MYVWRNANLPADPEFADSFEGLGYQINENDQIRQVARPDQTWKFRINRNERWNIKHREALNDCIRGMVIKRLKCLGLQIMRLPLGRGENEPHVPIMVSKNIERATRVIVVFGEATQDLGIWAYRAVHEGINYGSAVDFVKGIMIDKRDEDVGLIIANTGQLLWHCASQRAITMQTWQASPRPFANMGQPNMSGRNRIDHNGDWCDHVKYVFDRVVWPFVNGKSTRVDVIGMSEGGIAAVRYLQRDWSIWKPYISGMCLGDPQQTTYSDLDMANLTDPNSFVSFFASRCRAYVLSDKPVGKPEYRFREHGCNCYSSGESLNNECIMPAAWMDMVAWLDILHEDPSFTEQVMWRDEDLDDEMREELNEQVRRDLEEQSREDYEQASNAADAGDLGLEEDMASVSLQDPGELLNIAVESDDDKGKGKAVLKGHPLKTMVSVDDLLEKADEDNLLGASVFDENVVVFQDGIPQKNFFKHPLNPHPTKTQVIGEDKKDITQKVSQDNLNLENFSQDNDQKVVSADEAQANVPKNISQHPLKQHPVKPVLIVDGSKPVSRDHPMQDAVSADKGQDNIPKYVTQHPLKQHPVNIVVDDGAKNVSQENISQDHPMEDVVSVDEAQANVKV